MASVPLPMTALPDRPLRILCVAAYRSNHCDRHVTLLAAAGHDVHLAVLDQVHAPPEQAPLDPRVTVHQRQQPAPVAELAMPESPAGPGGAAAWALALADRALPFRGADLAATWLAGLVDDLAPEILHSFSLHQASFLTFAARLRCRRPFPVWIASSWGCDIHFFAREEPYLSATRATLGAIDGFFAECAREPALARQFGLRAPTLAVQPIGGGFDLDWFRALRNPHPPSRRRTIMLKGYQGLLGRAATAIAAIRQVAPALQGYRLAIYGVEPPDEAQAAALRQETGLDVVALPWMPYRELMRQHGEARCSIALSVSDGLCTSALEAMLMGSLPVQSDTACIADVTGTGSVLLVPPDDPGAVAAALHRALDDDFVDWAVRRNDEILATRLSHRAVDGEILAMYDRARHLRR